jgi:hypothetical protein
MVFLAYGVIHAFEAYSEEQGYSYISGRYVRETENEKAKLEVTLMSDGRVHVTGLSLWGTKTLRDLGPNIGEVDFIAPIKKGRVIYIEPMGKGRKYKLELIFEKNRLIAKERDAAGYLGLNVSFAGEYRKQ